MSDSDDEPLQLSSAAMAALQEFYAEQQVKLEAANKASDSGDKEQMPSENWVSIFSKRISRVRTSPGIYLPSGPGRFPAYYLYNFHIIYYKSCITIVTRVLHVVLCK